jgi:NAD(P)H-quinone oxidoreductase subunit 5
MPIAALFNSPPMTDSILQSVWLIPFYGLLGAALSIPWCIGLIRETGPRPAAYLNILLTLVGTIHGAWALAAIWGHPPQTIEWQWFSVVDVPINLSLTISRLTLGALEVVTALCLLTQLFALGYMEKDWALARFFGLLGFFEAALSGLALSESLLLSYGLLELLTLSTYLLVGFWYAQPKVVTAARDAFLTKRVGDVFLLMGVIALACYAPDLTFSGLEAWAPKADLPPLAGELLGLALIAGPIGKCAQFPLNLWLDEAMEGPSPASILRNSVVVSAGAYVLIELQPILVLSPIAQDTLIVLGTLTAIGASLVAIGQVDIKRTLSHSTSAYLGLVFMAIGFGHIEIALSLLLTHGVAKALMSMSSGSVILTTTNQDLTEMGGLWSRMPATAIAFAVGALSCCAMLPLGMFWGMERWLNDGWGPPLWAEVVILLVNALSALNLTRVFRMTFLGEAQAKTRRAPEVPWPMAVPMVTLTIGALVLPWGLEQLISSPPVPAELGLPAVLLIASGLMGFGTGFLIPISRRRTRSLDQRIRRLQDALAKDFYIEQIYQITIVALVKNCSDAVSWFDKTIVDGLVNVVGIATLGGGEGLRYSVSGRSQSYLVTMLVGVAALMLLIFLLSQLPAFA